MVDDSSYSIYITQYGSQVVYLWDKCQLNWHISIV